MGISQTPVANKFFSLSKFLSYVCHPGDLYSLIKAVHFGLFSRRVKGFILGKSATKLKLRSHKSNVPLHQFDFHIGRLANERFLS